MRHKIAMIATMLFYLAGGFVLYYLDKLSRIKMGVMRYLFGMKVVYSKEIFTHNLVNIITILLSILIIFSVIALLKKNVSASLFLLISSTVTMSYILNPVWKDWLVYYCGLIYLLIVVSIQTLWFIIFHFRRYLLQNRGDGHF
jgi:hypothetical protein